MMKKDYIYQLTEKTEEFLPDLLFAVGFKGVYLKTRDEDGEDDSFITYGIANDTLLQFSCDETVNSEIRNYFKRRCFTTASSSSLGYDTDFCDLLWQRYQESVKELNRYKNYEILQRYVSQNRFEYSDKLELFDYLITNGVAWSTDRILKTASKFPPLTKYGLSFENMEKVKDEITLGTLTDIEAHPLFEEDQTNNPLIIRELCFKVNISSQREGLTNRDKRKILEIWCNERRTGGLCEELKNEIAQLFDTDPLLTKYKNFYKKYGIYVNFAAPVSANMIKVNIYHTYKKAKKELKGVITEKGNVPEASSAVTQEDENLEKWDEKNIKALSLSPRLHTALIRDCHIFSISKLIRHTEQELRTYRNIGDKSIEELKSQLKKYGLSLAESSAMQ